MGKQLGRINASIRSKRTQPEISTQKEGERIMETNKIAYRVIITLILDSGRKINSRLGIITDDINGTLERVDNDIKNIINSTSDGWMTLRYGELFHEEGDVVGCTSVLRKKVIGYNIDAFGLHPFTKNTTSN